MKTTFASWWQRCEEDLSPYFIAIFFTCYFVMDFTYLLNNSFALFLVGGLAVAFVVLCYHYGVVFMRLGRYKRCDNDNPRSLPPVSVLLTVHNDADWLKESLPYLLEQDYPNYELIVVDFVSTDDTQFVLQVCSDYYERLKVVRFREDVNLYRGKKYPMSIGIQSAKNDYILFCEPDCIPKDFNWIRSMMGGYRDDDTQIVLGFCGIRQKKTLFNWLQVYDNLVYYLHFLSSALSGHPYTGSQCNLSYRRSFFFDNGAFYSHLSIAEGVDDIFVNQHATKNNTQVVLVPESFTLTDERPTLKAWHRARRERSATRRYYSFVQKLHLLIYPLMVFLFYGAGVTLAVMKMLPWQILVAVLVVKSAWHIFAMSFATKRFEAKTLHWFVPLFEIYFLFVNTFSALIPLSLKSKRSKFERGENY